MAEINSKRSPKGTELGYILRLQRLKKTSGNAMGGKGLNKPAY